MRRLTGDTDIARAGRPLPGEALESWLAALATRMNARWGEVLDTVLPVGVNASARVYRGGVLTTAVNEAERDSISAATGVTGAAVDEMTLAGRYGSPLTRSTVGPGARGPVGAGVSGAVLPVMYEGISRPAQARMVPAVDHHVHRASLLSRRHVSPVRPGSGRLGLVQSQHVHLPGSLPPLVDEGGPRPVRCLARLAKSPVDKLRPGHPVLTMQQRLTELLADEIVEAGVYRVAPVSAAQLLIDVQALGNRIVRAPKLADLVTLFGGRASEHEVGRWRRRLQIPADSSLTHTKATGTSGALRVGLAQPAAWVGTGVAAALTVLMQPSLEDAGGTLRSALRAEPPRELRRRPHIARDEPQCRGDRDGNQGQSRGFTVLDTLRYRTITGLPRLPDTGRHDTTHAMLHAVPTLFWPEWAFRLDTEQLPWPTARQVMSRLLLTIGCTMAIPENSNGAYTPPWELNVCSRQPMIFMRTRIGTASSPRYSGCTTTFRPTPGRSITSAAAA